MILKLIVVHMEKKEVGNACRSWSDFFNLNIYIYIYNLYIINYYKKVGSYIYLVKTYSHTHCKKKEFEATSK